MVESGQGYAVFVVGHHLVYQFHAGRILVSQVALLLAVIERERVLRGKQIDTLNHQLADLFAQLIGFVVIAHRRVGGCIARPGSRCSLACFWLPHRLLAPGALLLAGQQAQEKTATDADAQRTPGVVE